MECPSCHSPNIDNARFCAKCGALLPVAGAEEDPLIGQVIKNTFRITRMIGEGGMGRVYEGEQQMGTVTRKVAIKTLHPDLSRDTQIVARFNRECGTVAELEHPNTIQFFDFGQTPDGTLFIAMEFLEGHSIAKILETTGPMPPARVEHILKQVCGSLHEAHDKGIVHRDLKPENVVLITRAGEEDFAKVLDFGIAARQDATDAKKEQKLTQQGMVLGTPPYMSPEQFTGKVLDARSDIYSLGVMAYEMLTGKLPFDAQTPWEWATKHLTERPFPFEVTAQHAAVIPGNMKAAIMRALSKDREQRQDSVKQFLAELEHGAGAPVPVSFPGNPPGTASGTAMMAAPPPDLLQAAPSVTPSYGGHVPVPTANDMVIPVQAVPPPPVPARSSGGSSNKGIIVALIAVLGLGVVGGIVALVVKLGSSSGPDEGPISLPPPASVTVDTSSSAAPPPDTVATVTATATVTTPVATTKVASTATPTATATTTAAKGGPTGQEACDKSVQAANNGAIEQAVALYHACQKGGQTAGLAKSAIQRNAGPAAQQARFRHDCARARSIASSAASIGAAGTAQAEASQCK